MSVDSIFGEYQSQSTRQLAKINSTKYPDTNKDFEANLQRLNNFVDYIAQYLGQMQKGLDAANADIITRIRDVVADFTVLLGGGELLYGINLGDLQYFLPALGAIFGFDTDTPFPLNLFNMAQRLFLGYIVPLDAFVYTIQDLIDGWLLAMGVDQEFVDAINEVFAELIEVGTTFVQIITDLWDLLDIFGINTDGFGVFADIWHVITQLLGGFSLETLGNLLDPVFDALVPWVKVLHQFVELLGAFLGVFTGIDIDNIDSVGDFFGPLAPIFDAIIPLFEGISFSMLEAFRPVWDILLSWSEPLALAVGTVVSQLTDVVEFFTGTVDLGSLVNVFTGFLTNFSPLDALNIVGNIPANLLGFLPISSLSNEPVNMLPYGLFPPGSIAPGDGWSVDTTKTATADSTGSAKRVCDGKTHGIRSSNIIGAPGKTLDLAVKVWWASYSGSGTPFQLGIIKYKNNVEIGRQTIAQVAGSGTSSSWYTLSGTYVWPAAGTVDYIKLRCVITSSATGGTAWFDNAAVSQQGDIEQSWIGNLIPQFEGIVDFLGLGDVLDLIGLDSVEVWADRVFNGLYDVFGGVVGSASKTLSAVVDIGKDFFDTIAGIGSATFSQLSNRMVEMFQLVQVAAGVVVTPITSLITNAINRFQNINVNGLFDAQQLFNIANIPVIDQTRITSLVTDLSDRLRITGANGSADFFGRLRNALDGSSVSGATSLNLADSMDNLIEAITFYANNFTNTVRMGTERWQEMTVLANGVVTAFNTTIQNIINWWGAEDWVWW